MSTSNKYGTEKGIIMLQHLTKKWISGAFLIACFSFLPLPAQAIDGIVITDVQGRDQMLQGDILPDGSLVNGGRCGVEAGVTNLFCAAKSNADGSPDTSWGNGGKVAYDTGGTYVGGGWAGAIGQADGKVIIGGYHHEYTRRGDSNGYMVLIRYTADGSKLDKTFNRGKPVKTLFARNALSINQKMLIQPDDKILALGTFFDKKSPRKFALARYTSDGKLDSSFGSGGMVVGPHGQNLPNVASGALQGDKILVGGCCQAFQSIDDNFFFVTRYNSDGSLDRSFGVDGQTKVDFLPGTEQECARGLTVLSDNKIVLSGPVGTDGGGIIRLNADGSLDTSFGDGGRVFVSLYDGYLSQTVTSHDMLPDGKIALSIRLNPDGVNGNAETAIAIYNSDGTLNSMTGVPIGLPGRSVISENIQVDSLGQIVVFGITGVDPDIDSMLMRFWYDPMFDPAPILDLSFGWDFDL